MATSPLVVQLHKNKCPNNVTGDRTKLSTITKTIWSSESHLWEEDGGQQEETRKTRICKNLVKTWLPKMLTAKSTPYSDSCRHFCPRHTVPQCIMELWCYFSRSMHASLAVMDNGNCRQRGLRPRLRRHTVRTEIISEIILERASPVIFETSLLELVPFRLIPIICPARRTKPDFFNYYLKR